MIFLNNNQVVLEMPLTHVYANVCESCVQDDMTTCTETNQRTCSVKMTSAVSE